MDTRVIQFNKPSLSPKNLVLSLGGFDGIHLGHQALIKKLVQTAKQKKARSALCIFDPIPFQFLSGKANKRLMTLQELKPLLKTYLLDFFCIIPFDKGFSKLSPVDFLDSFLKLHFKPAHVIIGYDFSFAHQKSGDFSTLKAFGQKNNFSVEQVPACLYKKEPISSSRIRKSLSLGNMQEVKALLGRPYSIESLVVAGEGRGKKLGYPTANLRVEKKQLPLFGVYAGKAYVLEKSYPAIFNIGQRPTFYEDSKPIVEVHIPSVQLDLYEQTLRIELDDFIRPEKTFSDISLLKKQIQSDIKKAGLL